MSRRYCRSGACRGRRPCRCVCPGCYPFPREALEQRWRREIATPGIDCYVVLVNGSIVGFAATQGEELLHFGIDVEHWGTGIAQTAHDAGLERMRARGVRRAWLRVFTNNGRGRRFYEKLGWHSTGHPTRSPFPPYAELLRYEATLREGIHSHSG
jgi:RimJ/RimL family protein N-acetyltransferase